MQGLNRPFQFGTYHTLQVEGMLKSGGGTRIEPGTVVLSASGKGIDFVRRLSEDDQVRLVAAFLPPMQTISEALSGSHFLLQGGEKVELKNSALVDNRHPRTAVGFNSEQTFLVTVDGRQENAEGMNLHELTAFFDYLGAEEAINLDGGGSTTMIVADPETGDLQRANQPADTWERPVSNSLLVTYRVPEELIEEEPILVSPLRDWSLTEERLDVRGINARGKHQSLGEGTEILRLEYSLEAPKGETAAIYLEMEQPIKFPEHPQELGLWVYGDKSGHWLRAHIYDAKGELHFVDGKGGIRIDWAGWQYVTFELPRNLQHPFYLARIYLAEFSPELMGSGRVYFGPLEATFDGKE